VLVLQTASAAQQDRRRPVYVAVFLRNDQIDLCRACELPHYRVDDCTRLLSGDHIIVASAWCAMVHGGQQYRDILCRCYLYGVCADGRQSYVCVISCTTRALSRQTSVASTTVQANCACVCNCPSGTSTSYTHADRCVIAHTSHGSFKKPKFGPRWPADTNLPACRPDQSLTPGPARLAQPSPQASPAGRMPASFTSLSSLCIVYPYGARMVTDYPH
jgi:hypothetical protein